MTKIEKLQDLYDLATRENPNFYLVLGLEKDFEEKELKKAYRKLSMTCHPDNFVSESITVQDMAQTCSHLINQMYNTLLDPVTRLHYDNTGKILDEKDYDRLKTVRRHKDRVDAIFETLPKFTRESDSAVIQTINLRTIYHGGKHTFEYDNKEYSVTIPRGTVPGTALILREVLGEPDGYARKGHLTVICMHGSYKNTQIEKLDVKVTCNEKEVKFDDNGFLIKVKVCGSWVDTSNEIISHSKKGGKYKIDGFGLQNKLIGKSGDLIVTVKKAGEK